MKAKIIGNKKTLFGLYGEIDADKVLEALACLSEIECIDIDEINKASEQGILYITSNGKILEKAEKNDDYRAKYKIVPTGLKLRYTDYPLFASFIKMNGFWEGAFIGTGVQLFEMYKEHYTGDCNEFLNEYEQLFGGDNRNKDIVGFGLAEFLNYDNNDNDNEYNDTEDESHITELAKALDRCKKKIEAEVKANPKYKNTSKYNKSMRKAAKLEAHLKKLNSKALKEQENTLKKVEEHKICYNSIDDVLWLDVPEIEDTHFNFEDNATKEFLSRLNNDIIDSDESISNPIVNNYDYLEQDEINAVEPEEIAVNALIDEDKTINEEELACTEPEIEEDESDYIDEEILKSMDHDYIEVNTAKDKYKMQLKNDLTSNIYENLLCKEYWKFGNKNRLAFYLKGLFILVDTCRKKNKGVIRGNGYTLSKDLKKQVVNTGLIDKYGNYIYILDHTPRIEEFYDKKLSLVVNKLSLLDNGFDINDIKQLPSPIKIVDNKSSLIFNASINDFDLDDVYHLKHIIIERRNRLPKKYKNDAPDKICEKIVSSIRQAIKISKNDYMYIVPKYDFSRNTIQFLIPIHFDTAIDSQAELALVVGYVNGVWNIYTILNTDDAYDDARLLCKPRVEWLTPDK